MVNIADLDYSANANSGMRQVLYPFPDSHVPFEDSEGVLVKKIPRGPPGGAQSTPGALRGKKFCLQKWGPNNSECFDLPRSTIIKNTFLKK